MRIAKAVRECLGLLGHVNGFSKGLSRVLGNSHARFLGGRRLVTVAAYLLHSYNAKLLAVKRVSQSSGAKTPGIDGVLWPTAEQKIRAASSLQRRGYKAQPLRRIYIPKKNGKQRPLGIPNYHDRAQQALHLLALDPVAETQADPNSYGFRPKRSAADAIARCSALGNDHS